jgi:hypothetical protein
VAGYCHNFFRVCAVFLICVIAISNKSALWLLKWIIRGQACHIRPSVGELKSMGVHSQNGYPSNSSIVDCQREQADLPFVSNATCPSSILSQGGVDSSAESLICTMKKFILMIFAMM